MKKTAIRLSDSSELQQGKDGKNERMNYSFGGVVRLRDRTAGRSCRELTKRVLTVTTDCR